MHCRRERERARESEAGRLQKPFSFFVLTTQPIDILTNEPSRNASPMGRKHATSMELVQVFPHLLLSCWTVEWNMGICEPYSGISIFIIIVIINNFILKSVAHWSASLDVLVVLAIIQGLQ